MCSKWCKISGSEWKSIHKVRRGTQNPQIRYVRFEVHQLFIFDFSFWASLLLLKLNMDFANWFFWSKFYGFFFMGIRRFIQIINLQSVYYIFFSKPFDLVFFFFRFVFYSSFYVFWVPAECVGYVKDILNEVKFKKEISYGNGNHVWERSIVFHIVESVKLRSLKNPRKKSNEWGKIEEQNWFNRWYGGWYDIVFTNSLQRH